MEQLQAPARRLVASFLVIAAVALPLWAACGAGCMAEDMKCCEATSLAAVASPCCPAVPEMTERAAVATAPDKGANTVDFSEPVTMAEGVVDLHGGDAPIQPSTGPSPPTVPLFLLHSVSLT
jgi:hypothetical protein